MASAQSSLGQLLKSLTPVGRGDSVYAVASADRINNIQNAIRLLVRGDNIVSGVNIRKKSSDGYVILSSEPRAAQVGGGGFPFQISVEPVPGSPGSFKGVLSPGTINNIIPSNMFEKIDIGDGSGTHYVGLDVDTDGDTVTAVAWAIDPTPPDPIGSSLIVAPPDFTVLIGVIVDRAVFQIITSLLNATPQLTIMTMADTPVPGQPFYEPNYTWSIQET